MTREEQMVVIERDNDGKPTIWCDPEIVDLVTALNQGGVATVASCSGHGHRPGFVALADGRCLMIVTDDERKKIDAIFPVDINGDLTSEGEAAEQSFSDDELDKAIDYVGSGYGVDGPEVYSFLKELRDRRSADQTAPQPDQPDLEVVEALRDLDDVCGWINNTLPIPTPGATKMLCKVSDAAKDIRVRLTDAQAHIAALTAKVDALMAERTNLIATKREQIAGYRQDIEASEARVAQLEEALEKLRSYNVDIEAGRINYRPNDHVAVIDSALNPEKEGE